METEQLYRISGEDIRYKQPLLEESLGSQTRSVADTIAELRFQETVYQMALEVNCRAVSVLNLFNLTS